MINIWGICEYAEIGHPMCRWDLCCSWFSPGEIKRVETREKCCANCANWLVFNDPPAAKGK
jgi:hypothetical protein